MEDRANCLRRRIALYRQHLREGVDLGLAALFVAQIAADEAELAEIEEMMRKTNSASSPQTASGVDESRDGGCGAG